MEKELLEIYDSALCLLCRQSALLEHFETCRTLGIKVSVKEIERAISLTKKARERFLDAKEALGFEGELRFLTKEAAFHGFSYSGNCLQGDYSNLVKILSPMAEAPIHKKNCFKHEVAVLLLTHYYFQKGKYRMRGYVRIRFRQFLIFLKNKKRRVPKSREEK